MDFQKNRMLAVLGDIRIALSVKLCGIALMACLSLQSLATEEANADSLALEALLQRVEQELGEVKAMAVRLDAAPEDDREAMIYRRDEYSLGILKKWDQLVRDVATLPDDNPLRHQVVAKWEEDVSGLTRMVFSWIGDLNERITRLSAELESASGSSLIALQANVYSQKQLRIQLYGAMVDVIEAMGTIGEPVSIDVSALRGQLQQQAEVLAGRLQQTGSAITALQSALSDHSGSTEWADAEKSLVIQHAQSLERLSAISELLERLGIDNEEYKALLLQQGQSVSLGDLDSGLVLNQLREGWSELRSGMVDSAPDFVLRLVIFLLVLAVSYYLSRVARRAVIAACERSGANISTLLKDMLATLSGAAVMGIGVLMALSQIGISLGPMLAGLGVAGFIVGFALQDTLGNFAAGGMILIYRPYDVDDVVEVAGVSGLVKKMSLVSTTITTFDNQTVVVPNSKIWGDVIKNVTAQRTRRVDMEFGIGYGDDIKKAERILSDIISAHPAVLASPEPTIKLHRLADSSVNFIVRPWVKTSDYWSVYWDVTREVKLQFDREGVSIPFPQRDVHIYQEPA